MRDSDRIVIPAETTVAIIAAIVGLIALNYLPVGGFYDDGLYTILAKSLATGHGYRFLNLPGTPAAVHYPPGYPLLLALIWKIGPAFPANVLWFKLLNVLLLGVIAWMTCRYAVRVLLLSPTVAVLATLLGTITIPILVLSTLVLSESLFLALLIPALILAERMTRQAPPTRRGAVILGVLSGVVMLVRSVGVMLVIAVLVMWLVRRHWRAVAWYLGSTLVVVLPWLIWSSVHAADVAPVLRGSYGSYLGWFLGGLRAGGLPFVVATARVNIPTLVSGVATSFRFTSSPVVSGGTALALALLLGYGAWRARSRAPVTLVFLALYLGLVIVWPNQPLRFVWGVWPLLMALLLVPLEALRAPADHRRALRIGVAVVALLLAPGVLRYNVRGYRGSWWESIPRSMTGQAQPAISWVRTHVKPDEVVAGPSEPMLYLYAQRQAVPVASFTAMQYLRTRTAQENAADLRRILQATGARYLVVQAEDEFNAARILAADTAAGPRLTPVD
ncbi:MAG: ArnT family glycosyltransferase, partial [Gemmatimonadaceae bacterium]